jgi:hypothetical protein
MTRPVRAVLSDLLRLKTAYPQEEHEDFEHEPQLLADLPAAAGPDPPADLNEKLESSRSTFFEPQAGHLSPLAPSSLERTSSSKRSPQPLQ